MDKQNSVAAQSADFDHKIGLPKDSVVDEEVTAVISLLKRKEVPGVINPLPPPRPVNDPSPPEIPLVEDMPEKHTSPKQNRTQSGRKTSFSPTGKQKQTAMIR